MNRDLKRDLEQSAPQLFLTAPAPCPYLPGRTERKVFTQLAGPQADALHNALTNAGFRRSQGIAYRPACEGCTACVSVRVAAERFVRTRNFRRIEKVNADLTVSTVPCDPTAEQFSLLRRYLDARHNDGGMADMTALDYAAMVEETPVETSICEYRTPDGALLAASLTDELDDGLSMVYSFFDPEAGKRSPGTYMILDHVEQALRRGKAYVYLGYWVRGCSKMDYKARFRPLEILGPDGWKEME
ncbi:MAG: arginyltransferase, partial [Alphaproteobacteria bacterium]